ncbi:putative phage abortive infection protein [Serratia fonticola]|uniref:putative phage abortive infection protein n=1 Tax=Serratia fonticola TaxID=47917 RepID=UPI0015C6874D|nr:putative phage abortive infection protein [Serratia fonticola]NXZ87922.1 putative phage abortive infection protein [Serratia fonticola]
MNFNGIWSGIKRQGVVLIFLLLALSLISGVLYYYWSYFNVLPVSNSVEKWGQFGDYVGGVLNPGLSFISIVLVCLTLYSTSRQSSIQSFESVLFELLRFHKENLSEIKVSYHESEFEVSGRDALTWYVTEVKFNFFNVVGDDLGIKDRVRLSVDSVYLEESNFSNIGHYFRNIYHIFKHIDEASFLTVRERVKYAKLVRAQLSSIESGALFLNGLSSRGAASKKFIEEYSLLQEFSLSSEFTKQLREFGAIDLYSEYAYKDKKGP